MTDVSPAEPRPLRHGRLAGTVKMVFGLAVLAFAVLYVVRHRDELAEAFARLSWLSVLLAIPLAALAQLGAVNSQRAIMADLGTPLRFVPSARLYFVSQLGKYLPGSVWAMVALVTLSRDYHVPRKTSVTVGVLSMAFSIAIAFCVAAVLLPFGALETVEHYWYLGLLLPVLLVALHPRVVSGVLNVALRLIRRQPLDTRMSYRGTFRAAGWMAVSWLLFGLHAFALVVGIGGAANAGTLAVSIGGFAVSYGIGPLFLIAPAGAGIRETALVLTLGNVAGGSTAALAVALVSRIILIGVDFGQAGLWTGVDRRRRARTEPRAPVPAGSVG
jgi:glycosyltransferase 2 family protein